MADVWGNQAPLALDNGDISMMMPQQAAQAVAINNLQRGAYNAINAATIGNATAQETIRQGIDVATGQLNTNYGLAQGQLTSGYGQAQQQAVAGYGQGQQQLDTYYGMANQALAGGVAANASALSSYFSALGITNPAGVQEQLAATPGYQFAQQQGINQIQANAASKGYLNSGATLREAMNYTTGLADQTYQKFVANLQNAVGVTTPYVTQTSQNYANMANAKAGLSANLANLQSGLSSGMANAQAGLSADLGGKLSAVTSAGYGQSAQNWMNTGAAIGSIYSNLAGGIVAASSGGGGGGTGGGGGGGSPAANNFMGGLAQILAMENPAISNPSYYSAQTGGAQSFGYGGAMLGSGASK